MGRCAVWVETYFKILSAAIVKDKLLELNQDNPEYMDIEQSVWLGDSSKSSMFAEG